MRFRHFPALCAARSEDRNRRLSQYSELPGEAIPHDTAFVMKLIVIHQFCQPFFVYVHICFLYISFRKSPDPVLRPAPQTQKPDTPATFVYLFSSTLFKYFLISFSSTPPRSLRNLSLSIFSPVRTSQSLQVSGDISSAKITSPSYKLNSILKSINFQPRSSGKKSFRKSLIIKAYFLTVSSCSCVASPKGQNVIVVDHRISKTVIFYRKTPERSSPALCLLLRHISVKKNPPPHFRMMTSSGRIFTAFTKVSLSLRSLTR